MGSSNTILTIGIGWICCLAATCPAEESPTLSGIDRTDRYRILDRWEETIGHGARARRSKARKIRGPNDAVPQTYFFTEDGRIARRDQGANDLQPEHKIAPTLLARWENNKELTQRIVVWIVDRESKLRAIAERATAALPDKSNRFVAVAQTDTALLRSNLVLANRAIVNGFVSNVPVPPGSLIYKYAFAPAVAMQATQGFARQLAERDDVRFVFDDPAVFDELPNNAVGTLAPLMWTAGYTGHGAIVAVVGESGPVQTSNPFLKVTQRKPSLPVSEHATWVAGVIASTNDPVKGLAYDAHLLSASRDGPATSVSVDEAADWALLNMAMIMNCSQGYSTKDNGKLTWSDIYFDYLVHYSRVLFVKSAGNMTTAGYVTSPGRGYNSLAVGNVDDRGNSDWGDDIINSNSSSLDPETNNEKPEVASYGTRVRTTTISSPWVYASGGPSGTSLAAPMVAGSAAICVNKYSDLGDEPQALKAMMMASGVAHNVEGAAGLSEQDGAGLVLSTAGRCDFFAVSLQQSSFSGGVYELPEKIHLKAGDPTRIVLVYSHPPVSESADPTVSSYLTSDLDLELHAEGTVTTNTTGAYNPFEIIDYVPSMDGEATLKVRLADWHPSVTVLRVGIASVSKGALTQP